MMDHVLGDVLWVLCMMAGWPPCDSTFRVWVGLLYFIFMLMLFIFFVVVFCYLFLFFVLLFLLCVLLLRITVDGALPICIFACVCRSMQLARQIEEGWSERRTLLGVFLVDSAGVILF